MDKYLKVGKNTKFILKSGTLVEGVITEITDSYIVIQQQRTMYRDTIVVNKSCIEMLTYVEEISMNET